MAAVKTFDCNKIKHTHWPFRMKDEMNEGKVVKKGPQILVRMPQKGVFEAIEELKNIEEDENADHEAIYTLLAAVLNNNVGKVKITEESLRDYDIEECTEILKEYMNFIDTLKTNPN